MTSWVLVVRETEEPGMTAGILLCGPGLGAVAFPESGKTVRVVSEGWVEISVLYELDPQLVGEQMSKHVSQEKDLDRLH